MCRTRTADCGLTGTCCACLSFSLCVVWFCSPTKTNRTRRRDERFPSLQGGAVLVPISGRASPAAAGPSFALLFRTQLMWVGIEILPPAFLAGWLASANRRLSTVDVCHPEILMIVFLTHQVLRRRAVRRVNRRNFEATTMAVLHHNLTRRSLLSATACNQPKDTIPDLPQ